MAIAWNLGTCSVHDVVGQLPQQLAYTTVMTTLVRLSKKGMLRRRKQHRKFVYSPTCGERQWQQEAAVKAVERFLNTPSVPRELLVTSLQKAIREQEPTVALTEGFCNKPAPGDER
jgi:predicted transcriptional regulator